LSITKQSAARTITVLQERGYVARDPDLRDARRKRLQVTELGFEVLRQGEMIFEELRDQWRNASVPPNWRASRITSPRWRASSRCASTTTGWIARDAG
jgi:hypothetical protein